MEAKCLFCHKEFEAKRESAKYCSANCRVKWNYKIKRQPTPKSDLPRSILWVMEKYNCTLDDILNLFVVSKGHKMPPMKGTDEYRKRVQMDTPERDSAYEEKLNAFIGSKRPLNEPEIETPTQQLSTEHKAEISALKSEMAALGKDWIANKRRKQIEAKIKSLGGTQ